MLNLNSAPLREETPHSTNAPRTTISDALKRRAQAILNDQTIDAHTRAIIRYGLEINDPDLPELIRCADNGESILDNVYVASSEEKIEALTDLICRAGDEPSAALLVLLSTLENSAHPKALANTAKHLAFTRCGELTFTAWSTRRLQCSKTSCSRAARFRADPRSFRTDRHAFVLIRRRCVLILRSLRADPCGVDCDLVSPCTKSRKILLRARLLCLVPLKWQTNSPCEHFSSARSQSSPVRNHPGSPKPDQDPRLYNRVRGRS